MSTKARYKAKRFAANRFAAGKWRIGNEVVPFPDFMHGTLNADLVLAGSIRVFPYVAGDVTVEIHVRGKVQVNP